jgi:hypothetical protein
VDAKGHGGDDDSCYGEQGDQIFHGFDFTYVLSADAFWNGVTVIKKIETDKSDGTEATTLHERHSEAGVSLSMHRFRVLD